MDQNKLEEEEEDKSKCDSDLKTKKSPNKSRVNYSDAAVDLNSIAKVTSSVASSIPASKNLESLNNEKNRTDVIENTIIRNSNGNITYGPFEQNSVYSAYILACTKEPHLLLDNSNHFFKDDDCIKSYSLFYSITTLPPQNVSDIRLTPIDFESIKLDWVLIEYLLFK